MFAIVRRLRADDAREYCELNRRTMANMDLPSRALESAEGGKLLSEASRYEPGSPEITRIHDAVVADFSDPRVTRLLQIL